MSDNWTDRLSEYVDGDLAGSELMSVRTHIEECAECRTIVDELRRVIEKLQTAVDGIASTFGEGGVQA